MNTDLLNQLRAIDSEKRIAAPQTDTARGCLDEWATSGVAFTASDPQMETQYYRAVRELFSCIKSTHNLGEILHEGGVYFGCWLESTGTINTELLSRFLPSYAARTYQSFAVGQRDDGLIPYKLTADGPVFNQIQLVTPLARCVWNHYLLNGKDQAFLRQMYDAMARYDDWIASNRDTRNTGAVEAFCAYDTGHDLSARFWHVPDTPHTNDPAAYNPDNPILPFIAPDLTANIACQRAYLAKIATELGEDGTPWDEKADASINALFTQCYDEEDGFFYDRDKHNRLVKVQSDVLLRVLACEIGDDTFFAKALDRYLLNTGKFFAKYPFTSLALSDPRFDQSSEYNTWCGTTNFLSLVRAPAAFEAHNRYVELTWALYPTLVAMFKMTAFSQTIHPFTGKQGFTEAYSPTILCLLDFVERVSGILPRPEGTLWFTGLVPYAIEHRETATETAYARTVGSARFELLNSPTQCTALRDGEVLYSFPKGIRLVTDHAGNLQAIIGMSVNTISGTLVGPKGNIDFSVGPNEQLDFVDGKFVSTRPAGYVPISY